jgi:hypothetical protein
LTYGAGRPYNFNPRVLTKNEIVPPTTIAFSLSLSLPPLSKLTKQKIAKVRMN